MKTSARHLQVLEDVNTSQKYKKTKVNTLRNIIGTSRDNYWKEQANTYAMSLGFIPPNILSYENNIK